jgi:NAD+ kinase
VGPNSDVLIDVSPNSSVAAILITDGRRQTALPIGSRVEIKTSSTPIIFARLSISTFTDRLVSKFRLPVQGFRDGKTPSAMESADLHPRASELPSPKE